MRKYIVASVVAGFLMCAGTALVAQNWNAAPLYGTLNLVTGFMPDPQSLAIQAGGADAVANLGIYDPTGGACRGYINSGAPDVRVHYTSGTTYPIRFYVSSATDTTLLVNLPDTTWRCNDDYSGLNPLVHIDGPPAGQYDIWIGTYAAIAPTPATFFVTELTSNGP